MDEVYDLVVIGAGPAGEVAAELAAAFGRRVLVVERDKPGGVVTTTGGAPTKAMSSRRPSGTGSPLAALATCRGRPASVVPGRSASPRPTESNIG